MADKPVTREEKYLAYLTGDCKGEIPKPITRKEKYLYELCLKGMDGEISPEEIKNAVNEYLEKNPVKPGATTEQAYQIEQNKTDIASLKEKTNSLKEDIVDLKQNTPSSESVLTVAQVEALDGMFKKCAFTGDVTAEYEAFKQAFRIDGTDTPVDPSVTLSTISATYTGGDVTVGIELTALTGITVTAHYSDGSTATITDYTLSGTIAEGSNTITVSYGGKTTTFTVTGVAESVRVYGVDLTWELPDYNKWSENGNWFHTSYSETTASVQVGNGFSSNKVYSKPIDGSVYKYFRVPCTSGNQYGISNNLAFLGCDSPNALIEEGHTVTKCNKQIQFVSCDFAEDLENEGMAIFTPAEQFDYYYIGYNTNSSLTDTYPDLLGIFDANILENPLANPTE